MSGRLGELLVRENLITVQALRKAQEESAEERGTHRHRSHQDGSHRGVQAHGLPLQAVRRAGHQPEGLRHRPGDHQAGPEGGRREAPGHPRQPRRPVADRGHVRSVQHLRGGRPEVPHRLQHRVGGGLGDLHPRGHRALLRGEGPLAGRHRRRDERRGHRGLQGRGREPRGDGQGRGRRARGQAGEPHPHGRHQEGRVRHPRGALREGLPRALPHRRLAVRSHAPADEAAQRHHQPSEDHGGAGHLRAPPAAGRPHQDQDGRRQGDGLPRQRVPHAVRREGRHASARQVEPPARHDEAGLRCGAARLVQGGHRAARTAWCW